MLAITCIIRQSTYRRFTACFDGVSHNLSPTSPPPTGLRRVGHILTAEDLGTTTDACIQSPNLEHGYYHVIPRLLTLHAIYRGYTPHRQPMQVSALLVSAFFCTTSHGVDGRAISQIMHLCHGLAVPILEPARSTGTNPEGSAITRWNASYQRRKRCTASE